MTDVCHVSNLIMKECITTYSSPTFWPLACLADVPQTIAFMANGSMSLQWCLIKDLTHHFWTAWRFPYELHYRNPRQYIFHVATQPEKNNQVADLEALYNCNLWAVCNFWARKYNEIGTHILTRFNLSHMTSSNSSMLSHSLDEIGTELGIWSNLLNQYKTHSRVISSPYTANPVPRYWSHQSCWEQKWQGYKRWRF